MNTKGRIMDGLWKVIGITLVTLAVYKLFAGVDKFTCEDLFPLTGIAGGIILPNLFSKKTEKEVKLGLRIAQVSVALMCCWYVLPSL